MAGVMKGDTESLDFRSDGCLSGNIPRAYMISLLES